MEMPDQTYNEMLRETLLGKRLRADRLPEAHQGRPMYAFWGEDLGFSFGDVHQSRAYRIYLDYAEDRVITGVDILVEGELISPCSGYYPETLDRFDYETVRNWCLRHLER